MKLIQCLSTLVIFFLTVIFSQSTLAYSLFTYTSQELPFLQGYVNGEPNDGVGSNEPLSSLKVSFIAEENNLSATFLSGDITIGMHDHPTLEDVPATNSSITLNTDGTVAAWNFVLAMVKTSPQTEYGPPQRDSWFVESSYGAGTCNCDRYLSEWDNYIQRPYDTWQYAGTLGVLYGGPNDPGNWSIEKINVPEPQSYILLLTSLAMIILMRSRRKIVF